MVTKKMGSPTNPSYNEDSSRVVNINLYSRLYHVSGIMFLHCIWPVYSHFIKCLWFNLHPFCIYLIEFIKTVFFPLTMALNQDAIIRGPSLLFKSTDLIIPFWYLTWVFNRSLCFFFSLSSHLSLPLIFLFMPVVSSVIFLLSLSPLP